VCGTLKSAESNVGFLIYKKAIKPYYDACGDDFVVPKNFKLNIPMTAIQTSQTSVTYDMLNKILRKLIPAGIPQHLLAHHRRVLYGTIRKPERILEGLSIDTLKFVFALWICGCGISATTLALEFFIATKLRKIQKRSLKCWKVMLNKIHKLSHVCYNTSDFFD
jgi:hypothetical protein